MVDRDAEQEHYAPFETDAEDAPEGAGRPGGAAGLARRAVRPRVGGRAGLLLLVAACSLPCWALIGARRAAAPGDSAPAAAAAAQQPGPARAFQPQAPPRPPPGMIVEGPDLELSVEAAAAAGGNPAAKDPTEPASLEGPAPALPADEAEAAAELLAPWGRQEGGAEEAPLAHARRPVPEVVVLADGDDIYDGGVGTYVGSALAAPQGEGSPQAAEPPALQQAAAGDQQSDEVTRGHDRWASLHRAEPAAEEQKGYPTLPAAESWPELLRSVAGAPHSQQSPCSADCVLLGLSWPFGFGSRVTTLINEVLVAMYFGLPISLCRGDYAMAVWAKHFENRAGVALCDAAVCSDPAEIFPNGGWSHEIKERMCFAQGLARTRRNYTRDLKRFIASSFFSLDEATRQHVDGVMRGLALEGKRFAGVHVRHGDSGYDGRRQWEASAYAESLRPHLEDRGIVDVFVASDDAEAFGKLQEALGPKYAVVQQPRLDPVAYQSAGPERDEAALMALLVDMEVLRRSHVFVDTATGNLGRVVYYLRDSSSGPSVGINGDFMDPPVEDVFRDCTTAKTY